MDRAHPTRATARSCAVGPGTLQELLACVQRRLVHDRVEQPVERAPELRAFGVAELQQIAAVDGKILEPVWLLAFLFEKLTQSCSRIEFRLRDPLAAQVGLLVRHEVEREL